MARSVLPLAQLVARGIHLRKPPSLVEILSYMALFGLVPAVSPANPKSSTVKLVTGLVSHVGLYLGCVYPHFDAAATWPQVASLSQTLALGAHLPNPWLESSLVANAGLFMVISFMFLETTLFAPAAAGAATTPVTRGKREQMTQDMFRKSKLPSEQIDAIVVGSGIGGLATAALLSRVQGKRVLVLEKHYRSGGCTHIFDEYGDLFDSGIHYVGAPAALSTMMSMCGDGSFNLVPMGTESDDFLYDQFDIGEKVNGKQFVEFRAPVGNTRAGIFDELRACFPSQLKAINDYDKLLKKLSWATYTYVAWSVLSGPLYSLFGNSLRSVFKKYADITATEATKQVGITDKRLEAIVTGGQLIDWNVSPDVVSFFVAGQMMNYYDDGGFYPEGGSDKIAEAIIPVIEEHGGRVLTQINVESIVVEDGVVQGVMTDKAGLIEAPVVISNAGAINTYQKLLSEEVVKQFSIPRIPFKTGRSHMTAFVSLDGICTDFDLRPANIHSFVGLPAFDYSISDLERALFKDPKKMAHKALVTLTCPSAKDPLYQDRYPGCSNVLLLAEADWSWFEKFDSSIKSGSEQREPEYKAFCKFWEEVFLERLYFYYPKTKGKIKQVHIGTPLTNQYYINSPQGASYGLDWTVDRFENETMELLRTQTKIPNLWCTGTDSLFGGFCGAMMGGVVTFLHMSGFVNNALLVCFVGFLSWLLGFGLVARTHGMITAVATQATATAIVVAGLALPIVLYRLAGKVLPAGKTNKDHQGDVKKNN